MKQNLSVSMLKRPLCFHEPRERGLFVIPQKSIFCKLSDHSLFVFDTWYFHGFTLSSPEAGMETRTLPILLCSGLIFSSYCGIWEGKWNLWSNVPETLTLCVNSGHNEQQSTEWTKRNKISFSQDDFFYQNYFSFPPRSIKYWFSAL